ncbi:cytochrome o ubiquinol oxidase subunit IV [Herbaspirillum rhizosphaerae]|uniref:Cytochrome bo(3) ubiquinol oxidase subunit 4 n=1 Tax=Herbaspirillum rhizosphaerae TaxID=346179 RepID=A0ABW8ZCP2_9BURK
MSAPQHQSHPSHAEKYGHEDGFDVHHHDHTADHGSLKSYTIGFVLAVILTAIPFWLVMGNVIEKSSTAGFVLLGLAVVQIVVHMIYFLHMNSKSEGGWTILALIFTIMVVVIMLAGSLWVMYHLNHNMMPGMSQDLIQEAVPGSMQNMQHSMPGMK